MLYIFDNVDGRCCLPLQASIDSIETGLTDTETYIHNNASNDVKALLKVYATRLTGIADSFVSYTDNAVSKIIRQYLMYNLSNKIIARENCNGR